MRKYRNYSDDWLLSSKTYVEHVTAMTNEVLRSKSDIAAELAWRDEELEKANERVKELEKAEEKERLRKEYAYRMEEQLIQENKELKRQRFRTLFKQLK